MLYELFFGKYYYLYIVYFDEDSFYVLVICREFESRFLLNCFLFD